MSRLRVLAFDERGQIFPLLAIGMLVISLGFAALVVDFGNALSAKRRLQAAADSAAIAGAQVLPDGGAATATAGNYGAHGKNALSGLSSSAVSETVATACTTKTATCASPDAVVVKEAADVPTSFARVLGINSLHVTATAAACRPCGTEKLDIMLLLDRTGSMCQDDAGNWQRPTCPDLQNARDGIRTLLTYLDPNYDWVGLAVTPPALKIDPADWDSRCTSTDTLNVKEAGGFYPLGTDDNYVLVSARSDYKNPDGTLDDFSPLLNALDNCVQAGGSTAYALALEKANADLLAHGRPGVKKVLIFLSDGGANSAQQSALTASAPWSPYITQPCAQGIRSAQTVKNTGTLIYTIGYDVASTTTFGNSQMQCYQAPHGTVGYLTNPEVPAIAARDALRQIASSPDMYYEKPDAGELKTIYTHIAAQLGSTKLIPDPTTP